MAVLDCPEFENDEFLTGNDAIRLRISKCAIPRRSWQYPTQRVALPTERRRRLADRRLPKRRAAFVSRACAAAATKDADL